MSYMRIHCNYCGQAWEVYGSRDWNNDRERSCPHCQQEIDLQTWRREILPAFGSFSDANRELFKDHTGHHTPLFTIDFVADHIFTRTEKEDLQCPFMYDLEDILDSLTDIKGLPEPGDLADGLDGLDLFDMDNIDRE